MRAVAILRFSRTEGPAFFADWLDARGIPWQLVALDENATVPIDPKAYAGIGMMGGPMSVNDALPWVDRVCGLLRDAVAAAVPVIGHCLGGQLLAKALGARVARAPVAELGWIDVEVTSPSARENWFGRRSRFATFQWHYDAFDLPAGAVRVLTNRFNPNQGYVIDDRHIGLQCHLEMTRDLVATWLAADADLLPKLSSAAMQCDADIRRNLDARVAALNAVAGDVYARWARNLAR
jgi:GMP synthase-like glutamine amidotransferase